jgi:hypothetical protein
VKVVASRMGPPRIVLLLSQLGSRRKAGRHVTEHRWLCASGPMHQGGMDRSCICMPTCQYNISRMHFPFDEWSEPV